MIVVCMGERDRGLPWVWHPVGTDIFRVLFLWWEVWYRAGSQPGCPQPPLSGLCQLTSCCLNDWLSDSGVEKLPNCIFSGRPHIFLSGTIPAIPFHCLLFTLRPSYNILFRNSQLTCCQRSICNRRSFLLFYIYHLTTQISSSFFSFS